MMDHLLDAFKWHAGAMDGLAGALRRGTVTSFDPARMAVKCTLRPDDIQTGWCPVLVQWVGNGWGLVSPPSAGDQVALMPEEADASNFVVIGRYFSKDATPPQASSGDLWLVHQSGAYIKLLAGGAIQSKGAWSHEGDFSATGEITGGSGGANIKLTQHTHNNGDPDGSAETAAPTKGT